MSAMPYYNRPTVLRRRVYDPLVRVMIKRLGFTGFYDRRGTDSVQVLAVRGRRTGQWHERPVGVCVWRGDRHIIGFYGHTQWARNLQAAGTAQLRVRDRVEQISVTELAGDEKSEFMRFLVRRYGLIARAWFKVRPKNLSQDDLDRLVANHPVFRIATATAPN